MMGEMPELPDIVVYVEALGARVVGARLVTVVLRSPFLLRSVAPPLAEAFGRAVVGVRRLGKRIVFEVEGGLFLVVHLMVAGRFSWRGREEDERPGARKKKSSLGKFGLAVFEFTTGSLALTEAGSKKRASLTLVAGEDALRAVDRGGLEVLSADLEQYRAALGRENHTLKRALTDPRLFSGIGNAYSDEILLRARLSPMVWTTRLGGEQSAALYRATREVLEEWTERLRQQAGGGFPAKVTAFRPEMGAHGRYGFPCPQCGTRIQRILYAENECNYCPTCQTGGKLLADRVLSRLLKDDWPRSLEELEERLGR